MIISRFRVYLFYLDGNFSFIDCISRELCFLYLVMRMVFLCCFLCLFNIICLDCIFRWGV